MVKFLITGATLSQHRGSAAMLISAIKLLNHTIPNSEFTILSALPEREPGKYNLGKIRVVKYERQPVKSLWRFILAAMWRVLHLSPLLREKLLREYIISDIVIDIGGDVFSDTYGIYSSVASCYRILLPKILGKPVVVYAQSIGPFKTRFTKWLSRFCLNRVDLLIVREEITKNYLQGIGVSNKIYLTADLAFLLGAAHHDEVQKALLNEGIRMDRRPIIGICASQLIHNIFEAHRSTQDSENPYISLNSKLVDYLVENLNAQQVVFIPEVLDGFDDIAVAKKIYERAKYKDRIKIVEGDYSLEILKGILGQLDLFITPRLHLGILAISMHVPTIFISYHHKTHGIIGRMLGQEKYIIDLKDLTHENLVSKLEDAWRNREEIRKELETKIPIIRKLSMLNGKLVKNLLETLNIE